MMFQSPFRNFCRRIVAEAFGFGAGACVAGCCGGGQGFDPLAQFRSKISYIWNISQNLYKIILRPFLQFTNYQCFKQIFRIRNNSKRRAIRSFGPWPWSWSSPGSWRWLWKWGWRWRTTTEKEKKNWRCCLTDASWPNL